MNFREGQGTIPIPIPRSVDGMASPAYAPTQPLTERDEVQLPVSK
jgi:hypothetical protein